MVNSRSFRFLLTLFGAALVIVVTLGVYTLFFMPDTELRGSRSVPPRDVSSVRMTDVENKEVSFTPAAGNLTLTFFGFTHCPDVCPTTLSDVRTALNEIGTSKAERVKVAMVSVDPARDTPAALTEYMTKFFQAQKAIPVRTDDQNLLTAGANAFGALYKVTPAEGVVEDVSHTSWLYAVDDTGRIATQWQFGTPASDIAHDLKILLA